MKIHQAGISLSRLAYTIRALSLGLMVGTAHIQANGVLPGGTPDIDDHGLNKLVRGNMCNWLGGKVKNHLCSGNVKVFGSDLEISFPLFNPAPHQSDITQTTELPAEASTNTAEKCHLIITAPHELAVLTENYPKGCIFEFFVSPIITRTAYAKDGQKFISGRPGASQQAKVQYLKYQSSWPDDVSVPQYSVDIEAVSQLQLPAIQFAAASPSASLMKGMLILAHNNWVVNIHFVESSMPANAHGYQNKALALSVSPKESLPILKGLSADQPAYISSAISLTGGTPRTVADDPPREENPPKDKDSSTSESTTLATTNTATNHLSPAKKGKDDEDEDDEERRRKQRLWEEEQKKNKDAAMTKEEDEDPNDTEEIVVRYGPRDTEETDTPTDVEVKRKQNPPPKPAPFTESKREDKKIKRTKTRRTVRMQTVSRAANPEAGVLYGLIDFIADLPPAHQEQLIHDLIQYIVGSAQSTVQGASTTQQLTALIQSFDLQASTHHGFEQSIKEIIKALLQLSDEDDGYGSSLREKAFSQFLKIFFKRRTPQRQADFVAHTLNILLNSLMNYMADYIRQLPHIASGATANPPPTVVTIAGNLADHLTLLFVSQELTITDAMALAEALASSNPALTPSEEWIQVGENESENIYNYLYYMLHAHLSNPSLDLRRYLHQLVNSLIQVTKLNTAHLASSLAEATEGVLEAPISFVQISDPDPWPTAGNGGSPQNTATANTPVVPTLEVVDEENGSPQSLPSQLHSGSDPEVSGQGLHTPPMTHSHSATDVSTPTEFEHTKAIKKKEDLEKYLKESGATVTTDEEEAEITQLADQLAAGVTAALVYSLNSLASEQLASILRTLTGSDQSKLVKKPASKRAGEIRKILNKHLSKIHKKTFARMLHGYGIRPPKTED